MDNDLEEIRRILQSAAEHARLVDQRLDLLTERINDLSKSLDQWIGPEGERAERAEAIRRRLDALIERGKQLDEDIKRLNPPSVDDPQNPNE